MIKRCHRWRSHLCGIGGPAFSLGWIWSSDMSAARRSILRRVARQGRHKRVYSTPGQFEAVKQCTSSSCYSSLAHLSLLSPSIVRYYVLTVLGLFRPHSLCYYQVNLELWCPPRNPPLDPSNLFRTSIIKLCDSTNNSWIELPPLCSIGGWERQHCWLSSCWGSFWHKEYVHISHLLSHILAYLLFPLVVYWFVQKFNTHSSWDPF